MSSGPLVARCVCGSNEYVLLNCGTSTKPKSKGIIRLFPHPSLVLSSIWKNYKTQSNDRAMFGCIKAEEK